MTREEIYTEQLKVMGIYQPAFDPEIQTLAEMERDLQRVKKAWRETAKEGRKPSPLDPHFELINKMRREILNHRDALGLTPKAMKRLSRVDTKADEKTSITTRLDEIAERVGAYDQK